MNRTAGAISAGASTRRSSSTRGQRRVFGCQLGAASASIYSNLFFPPNRLRLNHVDPAARTRMHAPRPNLGRTASTPCEPRETRMAEITLEKLTKVYPDGTAAVSDVDLEIADGQLVVFVGPSGCGKTTALRMIAGLETITSGEVTIAGHVVNDVPPKHRDIAMVFQNYALYPHMNAADNMGFGLKMRGMKKSDIDRRVTDAAKVLGLEEVLRKKPRTLSGGQRQRVAMGRAIVREPQAFLMDEPLSNLDAKLRVEMRAEIARIQRDLAATTIYVTHDQGEAMTRGDRVAVMRHGSLQQAGEPKDLYERPTNLFVAEFIGSPAMNLVGADIERRDGG